MVDESVAAPLSVAVALLDAIIALLGVAVADFVDSALPD